MSKKRCGHDDKNDANNPNVLSRPSIFVHDSQFTECNKLLGIVQKLIFSTYTHGFFYFKDIYVICFIWLLMKTISNE